MFGEGVRKDGANLIKTWIADKFAKNVSHAFVYDRESLKSLKQTPDYLLGI